MTNSNLWQTLLRELSIAYALFDADQRVIEYDALLAKWLGGEQQNLVGAHLLNLFPEFVGQELELAKVCSGQSKHIQVENVNRSTPSGKAHYFTLTAMACPQDIAAEFVIVVADVTEQGNYLQELVQNRNELRLLRRRLSKLNEQLDFLLKHYLPPDVAEALIKGELRPELGGVMREVSILFADARNFTTIAEELSTKRIMTVLNDYLSVIVDAIDDNGGTINQFQGDSVMAIFNTHDDQPNHAIRAVKAGIALQRAVLAYQKQRPMNERWFHFGVGINSGPVIIGNSGARWRYTYTAIGDTTNLAARITSAVPAYEVWISQMTYEQLGDIFTVAPLSPMQFKGRGRHTQLYRVLANLEGQNHI